jgi:FkbH-like protein
LPIEADGTSLIPQLVIKIFESYVWTTSEVSSQMRVHDIKAGIVRKNIFSSRDGQDSLSKLGTHLLFEMNQRESINRAAEISIKTNQFNFSQQRYSPSMLTTIMNQKNKCVVVVSVKDDISDSGRIALITIELIENNIVVSEFAISCRALGRGLENEIFFGALNWFIEKIGKPKGVILHFRDAKRNQPCIQWLSSSFGVKPSSSIYIPISRLETFSSKVSREFRSI